MSAVRWWSSEVTLVEPYPALLKTHPETPSPFTQGNTELQSSESKKKQHDEKP